MSVSFIHQMKILLVDDDFDALESLAMMLELDGHEVRTAMGPEEALQIAGSFLPKLAIIGVADAVTPSRILAKRLRSTLPAIVLVATTAHATVLMDGHGPHSPFDHVCTLPLSPHEFLPFLHGVARSLHD